VWEPHSANRPPTGGTLILTVVGIGVYPVGEGIDRAYRRVETFKAVIHRYAGR